MAEILILFLLILLNGIFAMSEIAMVSSRKVRLEQQAKKGDKTAQKALELAANPSKFFSTVQIGITLIGIFMGIYSGEKIEDDLETYLNRFALIQPYSETVAVTIIVVALTFFSLVLGELVPKRIGLTMPERITKVLAYPMYFISIITAPFIWLLTQTTELIIRIFGLHKAGDNAVTEEEIKAIVKEGAEAGTVQEIEQGIVENVFHLGDRKVNTLMTPRMDIDWLNTLDTPEISKSKMAESVHKSFPVCKAQLDNVTGIIYAKDVLDSILKNEAFELNKHVKPAIFLTQQSTAYNALEKLREAKQQIALVVDEFGRVQGILSMNDLIDALVGDIVEQLHENEEIIPRDDGSFLVDAALPLPDFARYFEIDIAEKDSLSQINTVGGLAFHFGNKIPHVGDRFNWENLSLEIIDMDGRRIDKILVKKFEQVES